MALEWYAVRCVFRSAWAESSEGLPPDEHLYEERITLWQASSLEEAIALAEAEAADYAGEEDDYLDLAQAYKLFDEPEHGAEIFSLMRSSKLDPDAYLDAFFDTGDERAQVTEDA
jgi:hypothetical protein